MVGKTIAHYEVTAKLGEGGMGVVYRARDTKLGRDVALKVLPEQFARDPQRMGRFAREAHLLASLNHNNIASIYGLEEQNGVHALVMELVEGPTLADRIAEGPIPLDEALPLAQQMAEALEYAHEHGIIHRDLKPANVKVTEEGTVKVLDFGLAKAMEDEAATGDPADSPTLTLGATKAGVILGTAAYMAPEQARAKRVDKRADIWAFGVVLYEMLTGKRLFRGEDLTETLASVVKEQPDLTDAPPKVRRLLTRCLEKDPKKRLRDISVAWELLEEPPAAAETAPSRSRLGWLPRALAGVIVGGLVVGLIVWALTRPEPQAVARFEIPLAEDQSFSNTGRHIVAISPDGTRIVHTANGSLWMRRLDQLQATLVPGTEGEGANPFFSADSQWIGLFTDGQLKRVSVSGGAPVTLCSTGAPYGASWGADGTILYGQGAEGIWRVPDVGGTPVQVITVEEGEMAHGPQMLPGGEWVLFTLRPSGVGSWDEAQIVVQSIETGERIVLIEGGRDARYIPTGHLVYALNNVLMAVPFDFGAHRVPPGSGAMPFVEGVRDAGNITGAAQFAVAANGTLVYVPGTLSSVSQQFVWLNRDGERMQTMGPVRPIGDPALSPDGRRVAFWAQTDGNDDIWVYEFAGGQSTRLTTDPGRDVCPAWSPNGDQVAFSSNRAGNYDILLGAADRTGQEELLAAIPLPDLICDWSKDGRYLFYRTTGNPETAYDLWYLERTEDGGWEPHPFLAQPYRQWGAKLSPNGRYVAFVSNESGRSDVYVRPFPEGYPQSTVSSNGGTNLRWSRDGTELFHVETSEGVATLMAVEVSTEGEFSMGPTTRLFEHPALARITGGYTPYDVSLDGQSFLIAETVGEGPSEEPVIRVVQNWFTEIPDLQ